MHAASPVHRIKNKRPPKDRLLRFVNNAVYIAALFGVAANIPQLVRIWVVRDAEGVSILSWSCFMLLSVFWLLYGWVHKERPIILANALLIIIQALIVWGAVVQLSDCPRPTDVLRGICNPFILQ